MGDGHLLSCLIWLQTVRNNLYLLNDVEIDGRRLKDSGGENARRAVLMVATTT